VVLSDAIVAGVLIGIFAYWGWDTAVAVNEETADSSSSPGRAAVVSTFILVGIYLLVTTAAVAWLGGEGLAEFEDETAVNAIASDAFASPLDKLVVIAVLTSALAATQSTVLPASRTALSMARHRAAPAALGRVHPRYLSPHVATWIVGGLSVVFYVLFNGFSESFYGNALSALGLLIAINYGLNGLSCLVFYRRELGRSTRTLFIAGVLPALGTLIFGAVFVKSVVDFTEGGLEDTTYWFGLQAPLVITIGLFLLAGVLMALLRAGVGRSFFARRRETAPPGILETAPAADGARS
jgi:amino acid transporter